ncbi:epithelial-stromal interaction protein 1 isoform X1 [Mugil cephalus]|uniref:epithelial-stromal interaction protein 1 isoform X1 n=1 Tax=Mugil cephalus TaxID=48193 RepID=UPI001FB75B4E|nr:epithelial-stromal interaction protein 1 isoform X1 [Mugil cephalus]
MDPPHRNQLSNTSLPGGNSPGVSGNRQTPQNVDRETPENGNPQEADRQPQYLSGFTVIAPNQSRRSKIKTMAQKEEEDLQRWKETHRVPSVHLNPERLGGDVTLAEARQKQFTESRCSKLQKKLKKEEMDRRRRQEEEEELQKMKTRQREKAEHLEQRRQQEEQRRREQFRQDHLRSTEKFLQRCEKIVPLAASSEAHMSRKQSCYKGSRSPGTIVKAMEAETDVWWYHTRVKQISLKSEDVERHQRERPRSAREVQLEHERVNSAFLDKLEGLSKQAQKESVVEAERGQDFRQCATAGHLKPDQDHSCSGWTEEAEPEPDYDWALMKLMNQFPDCCQDFLEDILEQCHGDHEQATMLLISTLS